MARTTGRARFVIVALVIAAAISAGWAVSVLTRNSAPGNPIDTAADAAKQRKQSNIAAWHGVLQVKLAGMEQDQVVGILRDDFDSWLGELTREKRELLYNTLAGHIIARVEPSTDKYIAFAESDRTTLWTTRRQTKQWGLLTHWYEYHTGGPVADSVTVYEMLDANIELNAVEKGGGLAGIGIGSGASWGLVYSARSSDELVFRITQALIDEDASYWFENTGQVGLPFQTPITSASDAIKKYGSVTVVAICLIVETDDGSRWNLHSRWVWDVELKAWICDVYLKKSHETKAHIWF